METGSDAAGGTRFEGSVSRGLLLSLAVTAACVGAGTYMPAARADTQPIAHLDASAEIVWVVETTQSPNAGTVTSVSAPQHIEIHSVDVDQTTGVFPPGQDHIQATVRDRTSTLGSIEVGQFGVTLTASDGQITSRYLVVDGGEPGNAPTGPAQSGFSPTTDYIQDLTASPAVRVLGWVQSGYIRLTYVAPDTPPASLSLPRLTGTAQQGQTLSASTGDWTGTAPAFAYQWKRCNALGAICVDRAGATGTSLQLGANDVGATIRVAVTATNGAGSVTAVSGSTAVVAAAPTPPSSSGGGGSDEGSSSGAATGGSRPVGAAETAAVPVGGKATPQPSAVVLPILARPLTQPLGPIAGRQFIFTLPVKRSDNGAPLKAGRMICDSTLAGKSITHIESFAGGQAQVWIVVPGSARGKQLKLRIKIMSGSQASVRLYTYRVR